MYRLPVVRRLRWHLARFKAAEQGNIAMIFAITLIPIVCFVGAAIDYTRAARARTAIDKKDVAALKEQIEGLSRTQRMFKGVVAKGQ